MKGSAQPLTATAGLTSATASTSVVTTIAATDGHPFTLHSLIIHFHPLEKS